MKIYVNEKIVVTKANSTVSNLLEEMTMSNWVAVFVNGKQLLLSEYESHKLKENDKVKIFKPLSGG